MTPKNSEVDGGGDLPEVSAGEESPKLRVLRRATAVVVARGDRVGGLSAGTSSSPEREFAHPRRVEAALSGRSAKIAAVALAIALLLLFLVALLGAASFTPRPLAAAAVLIGLCAGALTAFATSDPYLVACAACLPTCALFTLQTIRQTLDAAAAARRAARPRRRPHPAPTRTAENDQVRRAA
jgi:hypothetical protein